MGMCSLVIRLVCFKGFTNEFIIHEFCCLNTMTRFCLFLRIKSECLACHVLPRLTVLGKMWRKVCPTILDFFLKMIILLRSHFKKNHQYCVKRYNTFSIFFSDEVYVNIMYSSSVYICCV